MRKKASVSICRHFGIHPDDIDDLDYEVFLLMERDLSDNPPPELFLKAFFMGGKKPAGPAMAFRTKEEKALARLELKRMARERAT